MTLQKEGNRHKFKLRSKVNIFEVSSSLHMIYHILQTRIGSLIHSYLQSSPHRHIRNILRILFWFRHLNLKFVNLQLNFSNTSKSQRYFIFYFSFELPNFEIWTLNLYFTFFTAFYFLVQFIIWISYCIHLLHFPLQQWKITTLYSQIIAKNWPN